MKQFFKKRALKYPKIVFGFFVLSILVSLQVIRIVYVDYHIIDNPMENIEFIRHLFFAFIAVFYTMCIYIYYRYPTIFNFVILLLPLAVAFSLGIQSIYEFIFFAYGTKSVTIFDFFMLHFITFIIYLIWSILAFASFAQINQNDNFQT